MEYLKFTNGNIIPVYNLNDDGEVLLYGGRKVKHIEIPESYNVDSPTYAIVGNNYYQNSGSISLDGLGSETISGFTVEPYIKNENNYPSYVFQIGYTITSVDNPSYTVNIGPQFRSVTTRYLRRSGSVLWFFKWKLWLNDGALSPAYNFGLICPDIGDNSTYYIRNGSIIYKPSSAPNTTDIDTIINWYANNYTDSVTFYVYINGVYHVYVLNSTLVSTAPFDYYYIRGYYTFLTNTNQNRYNILPDITAHNITLAPTTHGTVNVDKQEAEEGETVTVTVAPEDGYRMIFGTNGTKVTDADDNEIQINLLTPSLFTFEMPDSDVTVTVVFQTGNPYLPGGTSEGESDVPGEFDNRSDNIPVPVTPDINYSDSGLVRLFSPSSSQVISFGNYLWSGTFNFDNIIKAFSNPMDSLISFHKVPFAVETDPAIIVKFGGLTTTVVMPPVTKQLYDLDFGTIVFPKYYGSAFDYSPYSKAKIYLPYIGEIPLNIDRLIGKSIGVKYKCDCYSGTMIAYVTIDGQVYIQQSGSCLLPIPISMNNYQQLVTGGFRLLSGALGGMPQMATGFGSSMQSSVADMALSAVKPASDLLQSAFGKPETASSALGGGIAGYLGVQYPYITITRPKQSLASSFNNMYGYPLNVTDYLQNYVGFVKVSDITLHNTNATTQERDEIYRLLHTGIVIGTGTPPTYSTPEQNMKIVFERFVGRQNSVLKEITTVLECTGSFREYQDITNPKVRIQGEIGNVITNSNMVCIPSLKRRYFIEKVETNTLNSYDITLRCDVLESFWDEFKGSLAIIERAEQSYNLNLNDTLFVAEQKPLFQMLKFSSGFTTTSYILALSGNNGA